jgi:hypothetical protein
VSAASLQIDKLLLTGKLGVKKKLDQGGLLLPSIYSLHEAPPLFLALN